MYLSSCGCTQQLPHLRQCRATNQFGMTASRSRPYSCQISESKPGRTWMHCRHSQISRQIRARQHDVRTRALPDPEDQNRWVAGADSAFLAAKPTPPLHNSSPSRIPRPHVLPNGCSNAIDARARVRSEVLAPFRLVRLVLYGFFTVSATVGLVIALSQLAGRLADAPNALPLKGTVEVRPSPCMPYVICDLYSCFAGLKILIDMAVTCRA